MVPSVINETIPEERPSQVEIDLTAVNKTKNKTIIIDKTNVS